MEAGQTLAEVCIDLKIAKSFMSKILIRFKKLVHRQRGQGHKRPTTDSQSRYLAKIAKIIAQLTSNQIARDFASGTRAQLSRFSVSDRVYKKKYIQGNP